jgi:hypothetical protein
MVKKGAAEDRGVEFAAWLFAVKTAMDFISQLLGFGGVVGIRHARRESRQLVTGQLAFARQLKGKLNHLRLFGARQLLDFFNDARCCHGATLPDDAAAFN